MEQLFAEVDKLSDDYKQIEQYEALDGAAKKDPSLLENAEFLWRYGRACYEHGTQLSDQKLSKQIVLAGYEHLKKSMKLHEESSDVHKWYAIILDTVGKYEGDKQQMENALVAEKHFRRSLELQPGDPVTLHCFGVWHFEFADLGWMERKYAAMQNVKIPATTYEQALKLFQDAEQIFADFFSMNTLMIGKCYLRLKKKPEAIEWLKKARDWKQVSAEDRKAHEEAIKLLKEAGYKGQ